jgi:serine/threonine protein kinase
MLIQGTILRGRYQIIQQLGSGGFANTYVAEDSDIPKNRRCVVKHLTPISSDPGVLPIARRLFKTEAETLDELGNNDQIPRLLAHFEENGEFYLVQQFIDGHDLSQEITPGKRFSEYEVVKLLQDILSVLAIVHQRSIIHRDIKPQNIMRRRTDGKIILIDFGAVKEIGSLAVNTLGQVRSTIAIGTPGYMPNEQANRDPKFSSDIYAVGMIGIQALTGLLPQQLLQDPTGELIWRNYVQVSDDLAKVLNKMVRYHFNQRYQSASEALQAVNALNPQQQGLQLSQFVNNIARSISRIPKSVIWGSLIGMGGLAIGVLATVAVLNRSQPVLQSEATPTSSAVAIDPSTSSPSPTDIEVKPDINYAIEPMFDGVSDFSDGLAQVKINGKWGYMDKNGNTVIQPQFDETDGFSEGLARVWISGQNWGYIDKSGAFVIPQQFTKDNANQFSEGLARACIVSTCGYIDKTGRFAIDRKFSGSGSFSEGLAGVKVNGKWGYINKTGNIVIQPQFNSISIFSEGLAVVKIGDLWGYVNKTGNIVIRPQFDDAFDFSEDLAVVKINSKFGYINKDGKIVIQARFDEVSRFLEGLAVVKISDKWGYIDKNGSIVIQPQFDNAFIFSEGLAPVKISNKWGYINKTGNIVIQPQFDDVGGFNEGLAWVKVGDKRGYIRNPLK